MQTMRFMASLYVKAPEGRAKSTFSFQSEPERNSDSGWNLARDDMLQNFCAASDLAMNGNTPWRGPREKSISTLKMLIQVCTSPGDVVLDCNAATGSFSVTISQFTISCFYFIIFSSLSLMLMVIARHPNA